jgi:glycine hydroxymethyltransferase
VSDTAVRPDAAVSAVAWAPLVEVDPELWAAIEAERHRQADKIELIASENYVFAAVLEAQGSWLTNKYAEGLPAAHSGVELADVAVNHRDRRSPCSWCEHVNVQPHSGAQANMAAYFAVLQPGDRILGMSLAHGGHLTHGSPVNFSGRLYEVHAYGVTRDAERIDYDALEAQANEARPKVIVAGASAYPRTWDFERLGAIAHGVGALLFVDMAHFAGLVAAGLHPSPFPHADLVTTTTHKTLRGPRGGLVFSRADLPQGVSRDDFPALRKNTLAQAVDKSVFPGVQGGPLMHVIAAKAVAFRLAATDDFRRDQARTIDNARVLAETIAAAGARLVSGGTDNHLALVDVTPLGITGREAEALLDDVGITVNKNAIPFDENPPNVASGIRIGTPATTTRGMGPDEMRAIGSWVVEAIRDRDVPGVHARIAAEVRALVERFPVPGLPRDRA